MKIWCKKPWAILLTGVFLCSMPAVSQAADLSLADAVELALLQNVNLRITKQAEEIAIAALSEAKGDDDVSVSLSGSYLLGKNWRDSANTTTSGINVALKGGVNLRDGGKSATKIDHAKIAVLTAQLKTARAEEKLRLLVIEAYYNALQAKKTVSVHQEAVDNYQAHLSNVEQLFAAGAKARMDVLRIGVELSDARQMLIQAECDYEISLAKLRSLVNMDRKEPLYLTDDAVYTPLSASLADCLLFGAESRKELWIDSYDILLRELDIELIKAGYTPQVDFSVSAAKGKDFEPTSSDSHSLTAGIYLNWNIFDGARKKARLEAAEAALDAARLQMEKDQSDVDDDIRMAYFRMKAAAGRLTSTEDAVSKAQEDSFIAREKYRAGEGIMLDVIDAQLALSRAELNHINARYDHVRTRAQLETAMGKSLSEREQQAADAMDVTTFARTSICRADGVRAYEEYEKAVKERRDKTVIPFQEPADKKMYTKEKSAAKKQTTHEKAAADAMAEAAAAGNGGTP